ncbi:hypothetical protein EJB05_02152, partial [Eragrostis curvula]
MIFPESQNSAFPLLVLLLPVIYICYHLAKTLTKKKPTTHGLKSHPLLGHLPAFVKNRHRFIDWSTELIVGSPEQRMGFWIPGMRTGIVTANPADVEHVLRANFGNYPKGEHAISMLRDFLGDGLFNSDGEQWLWQRKNASLEFTKRSLRKFVVDVVQAEVAGRLIPLLRRSGDGEAVLDMQDVLERFAFDTICMVAFGHDPCCLADGGVLAEAKSEFMRSFGEAQDLIVGRFLDPVEVSWKVKKWLNVGTERRLKKAIADVHGFAMDIVRARRRSAAAAEDRDDVLSRFVASDDHSDEVLRDIVLSFLIAGRETTSSALMWFFWLVSSRPDVVARVADEVRAVRESTGTRPGKPFGFDALRDMHYRGGASYVPGSAGPPERHCLSLRQFAATTEQYRALQSWAIGALRHLRRSPASRRASAATPDQIIEVCKMKKKSIDLRTFYEMGIPKSKILAPPLMHYLHAALTESMRLYPPVPIDSQSCAADDKLPDGTHVGAGWTVMYSAYAMGRLAAIWGEDCMEYRPERWLGDDGAFQPASPFRYTVFHAGPRMCLGKEMAYVQMKSIVASVLEEFVVDVVGKDASGGVPEHVLSVTLRMKGGLPVQVRTRVAAGKC